MYNFLKDMGSFLGAVIALFAAWIAYMVVNRQIKEAQKEENERREIARRIEAQEKATAAALVEAALVAFEYDIDYVINKFYPSGRDDEFDSTTINSERASSIRQKLRPLVFEPLLPYVGRIHETSAREYSIIFSISERFRDTVHSTYGELRNDLDSMLKRTQDLRKVIQSAMVSQQGPTENNGGNVSECSVLCQR